MTPMNSSVSRRALLGGTAAAAVGGLAACQRSGNVPGNAPTVARTGDGGAAGYNGPEVSLAFWNGFTGGDGPVMKALVDQFMAEHANIKVTQTTMPWGDYYSKLPTAVTAGKAPEVAIMHADSVATNAARQVLQPLDDVAKALNLSEADFAPVPWKGGLYKDIRYAIPLDVHPMGFYYNKKVMEQAGLDASKPPTNNDEYMAALETMKGKGIQGYYVAPFQFTGTMSVEALLWQFGGDLLTEDNQNVAWDSEAGVKALTWYSDMVKLGYSPAKQGQDADALALQNDKTAFNWNGIWMLNTLAEKTTLQWDVAPLPQIGERKAAWAGSHQFVLPVQKTNDDNKQTAARVFVNWISEHSIDWAKGGQVPARNSVRESADFTALTKQSVIGSQIDDLHFPPPIPGIGDVVALLNNALGDCMTGGMAPKDALTKWATQGNKLLADNRKKYGA